MRSFFSDSSSSVMSALSVSDAPAAAGALYRNEMEPIGRDANTKLRELKVLCDWLNESTPLVKRVHARFVKLSREVMKTRRQAARQIQGGGEAAESMETRFAEKLERVIQFCRCQAPQCLLARLAETRVMLTRIQAIHADLDTLFGAAGLAHAKEMTAWRDSWARDLRK